MSNFPTLIPAFTVRVAIQTPTSITPHLTFVPFQSTGGTIISEPSYPIKLNAAIQHGADYIKTAPDGKHVRLDVQSTARDSVTGALVRFIYTGKILMLGKAGMEGAGTTGFGDAFSVVSFEVGSKELAAMEEKIYVGSGQFIIESGKPVIVEYKVSEVSA